jgi:AcrR family transcriptional regulator
MTTDILPGQRGPAEHERRVQILEMAEELFRDHGYRRTSVTDVAKAVGVSSAYIYRFFDSKQAIGEAVCAMCLAKIDEAIREVAERDEPATQRLREMLQCLLAQSLKVFLRERRLHDIIVAAIENEWQVTEAHEQAIYEVIEKIVSEGRESGEFERKTPLDEVCTAIRSTASVYAHPVLLKLTDPQEKERRLAAVTNLILRSLAP